MERLAEVNDTTAETPKLKRENARSMDDSSGRLVDNGILVGVYAK